ncbi:hypothetical protein GSI_05077 [Ganoderma sinense ZZ0214-1]|uniref:Uncharacterized protein n=1 Tax=Ganoderma sinense ZZ0214-1 TaxID=1077348 RepID=A0A2G8SGQ5_9APHY|nr:hypothetical protein GSI_05077 [Ganoderma sinense ZZ0214-1]
MLPTSLVTGLPHLRPKPLVAAPLDPPLNGVLPSPSSASVLPASPRLRAIVEDAPDDPMDDLRSLSPPRRPVPVPPPAPTPISIDTQPNQRFSVFRRYTARPRSDPEEGLTLNAFADAGTHLRAPRDARERDPLRPFGSSVCNLLSCAGDVSFECDLKAYLFRHLPYSETLSPDYMPTGEDLFRLKESQPPPVAPEQITPLSSGSYDDGRDEDLDKEPTEDHTDLPEEPERPPGVDEEGPDPETSEVGSGGSQELDSDDDEALGPEDGEAEMGEDEYELAHVDFASW